MPLHANSRKVIIMNAVEITIIVVAAVLLLCGILFGVVSYLVFYEVIARNSKIPGKIDANAKKKMMETNPEKFLLDPREEWLNDQTFENYSITNVDGNKLKGYLLKADKPSDVYVFPFFVVTLQVTTAFPTFTAFTTPFLETVAMDFLLLDHFNLAFFPAFFTFRVFFCPT